MNKNKNRRVDRLNQVYTLKTIGIYVLLIATITVMCLIGKYLNQ